MSITDGAQIAKHFEKGRTDNQQVQQGLDDLRWSLYSSPQNSKQTVKDLKDNLKTYDIVTGKHIESELQLFDANGKNVTNDPSLCAEKVQTIKFGKNSLDVSRQQLDQYEADFHFHGADLRHELGLDDKVNLHDAVLKLADLEKSDYNKFLKLYSSNVSRNLPWETANYIQGELSLHEQKI